LPIKQLPLTIPLLTKHVSSAVSVSSLGSAVSDAQSQLTPLTTTSTYSDSDLKQLTSSCKLALSEGKSKTYCIENILGFKGREFVRGKELFNQLMGEETLRQIQADNRSHY
jgi:hypothetical protein